MLFEAAEVNSEGVDLFVEGVEFEAGLGDEQGIVEAVGLDEEIGQVENGFGIPRAEGEGLQTGEVGFFEQALEFGVGPGPIFGWALRTEAPEVNAGDGAAQF